MPDASTLLTFAAASFALVVIPGPSVLYIVGRSVSQGRRAGIVSALGIEAGGLLHVVAAAVGISAVIASSATAFTVVKLVGAAYLIVLGLRAMRAGRAIARDADPPPPAPARRLFAQGVLVQVLNPKTALFFLAFLPQFVDPAQPAVPQALVLGTCFLAIATLSDGAYALLAGTAGEKLRAARGRLERVSGVIYLGLGGAAALSGDPPRGRGH